MIIHKLFLIKGLRLIRRLAFESATTRQTLARLRAFVEGRPTPSPRPLSRAFTRDTLPQRL